MPRLPTRVSLCGLLLLAAGSASAHHPLAGQLPQTLADGLMSGLAHPVIGIDHLAFVVGVGVLAACTRHGGWLPAAFLAASGVGVATHLGGVDVPGGEIWVALSLAAMSAVVFLRQRTETTVALALCALGGFAHGYLLTESIVGAEPTPLSTYLVGLFVSQLALSLGIAALVRRVSERKPRLAETGLAVTAAATLAIGLQSLLANS